MLPEAKSAIHEGISFPCLYLLTRRVMKVLSNLHAVVMVCTHLNSGFLFCWDPKGLLGLKTGSTFRI